MHFDDGLSARSKAGESTKLVTKGGRGKSASEKLTEEGLVKYAARVSIQVIILCYYETWILAKYFFVLQSALMHAMYVCMLHLHRAIERIKLHLLSVPCSCCSSLLSHKSYVLCSIYGGQWEMGVIHEACIEKQQNLDSGEYSTRLTTAKFCPWELQ